MKKALIILLAFMALNSYSQKVTLTDSLGFSVDFYNDKITVAFDADTVIKATISTIGEVATIDGIVKTRYYRVIHDTLVDMFESSFMTIINNNELNMDSTANYQEHIKLVEITYNASLEATVTGVKQRVYKADGNETKYAKIINIDDITQGSSDNIGDFFFSEYITPIMTDFYQRLFEE